MGINFIIIFSRGGGRNGNGTNITFKKRHGKKPGSNDGIAYIISQRYPRLRTIFYFYFFIFNGLLVSLHFYDESQQKKIKIDRNI